jgi:integrase
MPKLKMTDAAVRSLSAAPGERIEYFDAHERDRQRGLVLRVSANAEGQVSKTWTALYRMKGSTKLKRATVGEYPGYSLAQGRAEVAEIVQAARRGEDLVAAREAAARAKAAKERDTVETVVADFLKDWTKRPKRKGGMRSTAYIEHLEQYFTKHILPPWKGRHIGEIRRTHVDTLVSEIARGGTVNAKGERTPGGPIVANRCLAALKAFFNWCIRREMLETNPAGLVERPGAEQRRERVLTTEELRAVWPAFKGLPYPFGPFFRLALLTGQRREEIAGMAWAEIDEDATTDEGVPMPTWTIPAARNKAHRVHTVPLSPEALEVVEELKAYRRKSVSLLFSTTGVTPISGFSRAKRLLDEAITKARKEKEMAPLPRWTVHDLRRTAATEMSRLGTSRFIVARVINHADREVTGIYDRNPYLAEKKAALAQWAAYLIRVVTEQPANVASLPERRRRAEATGSAA